MFRNYLSVSTILRNESLYLKDWVSFHLKQGVEHFYLYDNSVEGEPDQKEQVKEYEKFITWHDFPGFAMQRAACTHTIDHYKKETKWCAFMDVDEYLYSPLMLLPQVLERYDLDYISGVAAHWLLFGSSGFEEYENKPVTQRFTRRAEGVNQHVKSIMKLDSTLCMGNNVHTFRSTGHIVDEYMNVLPEEYAVIPGTADILRINHYVTKSRAECKLRRSYPRCDTGELRSSDFFDAHDRNEVEDKRILEYV